MTQQWNEYARGGMQMSLIVVPTKFQQVRWVEIVDVFHILMYI